MSKSFVKVLATATVKESVQAMLDARQSCAFVVDENDLLEGIMTLSDLKQVVLRAAMATSQGEATVIDVRCSAMTYVPQWSLINTSL
jgi:CBS domain-containing protein